jgi:hypothetical protein
VRKLWLLTLRLAVLVLAVLVSMRLKLQLNRTQLCSWLTPASLVSQKLLCLLLNKLTKQPLLLALRPV